MTDQQINIAIAQACGWSMREISKGSPLFWHTPDGKPVAEYELPDYVNDLNAMYQCEETLLPAEIDEYAKHLYMIVERFWTCDRWVKFSRYSINHALAHATARQRAEAFLRVRGLWKDKTPGEKS